MAAPPVLPARAGMARERLKPPPQLRCSPRTRGDGPPANNDTSRAQLRSPRTRGDGPRQSPLRQSPHEFSPHARGWPGTISPPPVAVTRSPRTRGDGPSARWPGVVVVVVLPARAGMARGRGGEQRSAGAFSPHARGWPAKPNLNPTYPATVLPARAGMARGSTPLTPSEGGSPRTRGDGPTRARTEYHWINRSPRTRGDGP